jgi:hypothetical protein
MYKLLLLACLLLLNSSFAFSQKNSEISSVKHSVISFLKWYRDTKSETSIKRDTPHLRDTVSARKQLRLDFEEVERFVQSVNLSKLVSTSFLNQLRGYFVEIDNTLATEEPIPSNAILKVDGLDLDIILQSFEPELILNFIDHGTFKKVRIVGHKAIVLFYIPDYKTSMTFVLTKVEGVWLLDALSYY